jgi:germination protein M
MKNSSLRLVVMALALLLLVTAVGGCKKDNSAPPPADKSSETVTLYFSDNQAMSLTPEDRVVEVEKPVNPEKLAAAVLSGLIAGPENKDMQKTIPPEARLLGVNIKDGIAYADFSNELKSKHWGGSSGESMTVYSIVNSLTELPEIKEVQILIAGKEIETLAGHLDTSQPLERNQEMIKK